MYYKKIEGKHVYLSPIDFKQDPEQYLNFGTNRQIRYQELEAPTSIEDSREKLEKIAEDTFSIVSKDNELVGFCGITRTIAFNQRTDAFLIINPNLDIEKQLQYGEEGYLLFLKYCYEFLNLNSIISKNATQDEVLREIYRQTMKYLGTASLGSYVDGKYYDTDYFQLTKKTFSLTGQENKILLPGKGYELDTKPGQLPISLKGQRIELLRPNEEVLKENDLEKLVEYLNDYDIAVPLGEAKQNWFEKNTKEYLMGVTYWVMRDERIIGFVNLLREDTHNKVADMEYAILDKNEHNKGYATEALELFQKALFESNYLNSLISGVFDFNHASQRVMQKANMELFGIRSDGYYMDGKFYDMFMNNNSTVKRHK